MFGALADKAYAEVRGLLAPLAARRYYTEPGGRAPAPLEALMALAPGAPLPSPMEAVTRAVADSREGDTVIVAGSLYLVGAVRAAVLGERCDPVVAL